MTQSSISYNCNGQAIRDIGKLKTHLQKLQPSTLVMMDGFGLAVEFAAMLPNTIIIHRDYAAYNGDDDLARKVSPENWIDSQLKLGSGHIWRYCLNEHGWNDETINWLIKAINYNLSKPNPLKLVLGNWSVGNPNPDDLERSKELFRLLDLHRDTLILGLHEYFNAVPTSGFYGGYPNHAGVDPNGAERDAGVNLIPADKWPGNTGGITKFHCGRFEFIVNYCKRNGINPPRIILTEHGADDVSDIKAWANTLVKTPPYTQIKGYKTLYEQYRQWYSQWTPERAYFEALRYLAEHVYKGSVVEGQCLFTWSTNTQWVDFDLSMATEFQGYMEQYAAILIITPPVTPLPQYPTFPTDFDTRKIFGIFVIPDYGIIIRQNPTQLSAKLALIPAGKAGVEYIPGSTLNPSECYENTFSGVTGLWLPVRWQSYSGWAFGGFLTPVSEPPPVETKHTVVIKIKGLSAEQASEVLHNVEISIE